MIARNKFLFFIPIWILCFSFSNGQEALWAKEHFKNKYQPINILPGKIQPVKIKDGSYKIESDTLSISSEKELILMVENRLLNYFVYRTNDHGKHLSIKILKLIERNDNQQYRRFQFYYNVLGKPKKGEIKLLNATIYYIEITSDCEEECSDEEFYEKGRLTYVGNGRLTYVGNGGLIL